MLHIIVHVKKAVTFQNAHMFPMFLAIYIHVHQIYLNNNREKCMTLGVWVNIIRAVNVACTNGRHSATMLQFGEIIPEF